MILKWYFILIKALRLKERRKKEEQAKKGRWPKVRRGVDKGKGKREGHRTVGEKPSLRGWQRGDFMFACLCACFGFPR